MSARISVDAQPQKVKKFYFLEYFYVLLKSVQSYSSLDKIFEHFLALKQEYQLGESKYKRLTTDEYYTPNQMVRYKYTFEQVLTEAVDYGLVNWATDVVRLTPLGLEAIVKYEENEALTFNRFLFALMEEKYHYVFYYLLEICYSANPSKHGLLIFPIYSPHRLGFARRSMKKSGDIIEYLKCLQRQIEQDVKLYLGKEITLERRNRELIERLNKVGLLPRDLREPFDPGAYQGIVKRSRDFWLKYLLQDLYNYPFSLNSFEIWAYRGKQIGILHITEFYPNFHGRVIYPLSVLVEDTRSTDFQFLYMYPDRLKLCVHHPSWENVQEEFVNALVNAYFDSRETARTYFVNLSNIRERVCYSLKIPEYLFEEFLGHVYRLSLTDKLRKIRISLEVDKLPEETSAMYLKRAPVMVDGKYRNIIAIDIRK